MYLETDGATKVTRSSCSVLHPEISKRSLGICLGAEFARRAGTMGLLGSVTAAGWCSGTPCRGSKGLGQRDAICRAGVGRATVSGRGVEAEQRKAGRRRLQSGLDVFGRTGGVLDVGSCLAGREEGRRTAQRRHILPPKARLSLGCVVSGWVQTGRQAAEQSPNRGRELAACGPYHIYLGHGRSRPRPRPRRRCGAPGVCPALLPPLPRRCQSPSRGLLYPSM